MRFSMLFIFIILFGCGKKSSSSSKREAPVIESQIQNIMDNQKMECASLGGSCPAGITRLIIFNPTDPNRSGFCTGFMIGPTRLVTNHHCVATSSQCANTHLVIYNGSNYEQTKCKSIIKTEQDVDDPNDPTRKLDYTIMEIQDSYAGEHFILSETLAAPDDRIYTWVIDHTGLDQSPSNSYDSRITELRCRVKDQDLRASLVMMSCPIIAGNSGSPALNSRGEVIGVVWGGSALSINSNYDLRLRRALDALGLATEVNYFRPLSDTLQ